MLPKLKNLVCLYIDTCLLSNGVEKGREPFCGFRKKILRKYSVIKIVVTSRETLSLIICLKNRIWKIKNKYIEEIQLSYIFWLDWKWFLPLITLRLTHEQKFTTEWMDLVDIMLSEGSQTERQIPYVFTYIWNIKK